MEGLALATMITLVALATPAQPQTVPPADLSEVQWMPCAQTPVGVPLLPNGVDWCADLYFCTVPAASPATGGFTYGYRTKFSTACIPGAGPILRFHAGGGFQVTWHNTAPAGPVDPAVAPSMATTWVAPPAPGAKAWSNLAATEQQHTTNVHLHGIHVSGQGNHDNAQKKTLPGECQISTYFTMADHMGGTNLYHPQFEGRVTHQVSGGAFGMAIMEDQAPPLVAGTPWIGTQVGTGAALDPAVITFLTNLHLERNLLAFSDRGVYMGNGNPLGAPMTLTANTWFRLRIAHVKPIGTWTMTVLKDPVTNTPLVWGTLGQPQCEVYDIAQDGVYLTTTPWKAYAPGGATSTYAFEVLGSSRLDLAVRCITPGSFNIEFDGGVVARVTVLPTPAVNPFPATVASPFTAAGTAQWNPVLPIYLQELRTGPGFPPLPVGTIVAPVAPITVDFSGINAKYFDPLVPLMAATFNKVVYEFDLFGTDVHPVHLHRERFQVVQVGGCGPLREGQRYDTISTKGLGACRVRVQFVDFSGKTLLHSVVANELDMGVSTWFDVQDPLGALGSWEFQIEFIPASPTPCCVPLTNAVTGAVTCGPAAALCGKLTAINSCHEPCTPPANLCPAATPFCNVEGLCFATASTGTESLSSDSSSNVPIYPFILMAMGLAVGLVAVLSAVYIVRRRGSPHADTAFFEETIVQVPAQAGTPVSLDV